MQFHTDIDKLSYRTWRESFIAKLIELKTLSLTIVGCLLLQLILIWVPTEAKGAWQPIIGIPEPTFGVTETAPAVPSPWTSGIPGFYYVDPTGSGASDTGNPYGHPSMPRKSIPNPIPAGAVVEVHGQFNTNVTLNSGGTGGSPTFVRGRTYAERPTFGLYLQIKGGYLILENIKTQPRDATVGNGGSGIQIPEGSHHIAIRNSEISGEGNLNRTGGIGIGTWSYTGSESVSNVLIDKVFIHDIGDVNATFDQDAHGVTLNGSVDNLWLVNSEMSHCSGDGIQIEARQGRRDKIHHIYVGNCISHENKQSGMWIKHASDVIFSQNVIYGHKPSDSSNGQGTGFQYGPDYVWFLFNHIYGNHVGINVASNDPPGDGTECFFIGNLIHAIHATNPTDRYNSGGMVIRGSTNRHIVNNTIYDCDAGINAPVSTGKFIMHNNIFSNRTQATEFDVFIVGAGVTGVSQLRNSLFYNSSGMRINWGGSTFTNLSSFQGSTGQGQGCLTVSPGFVDTASGNFRLRADSFARDSGFGSYVYSIFETRYGIDIRKDMDGRLRPQGSTWDIGAYEYEQAPLAPKNVRVKEYSK